MPGRASCCCCCCCFIFFTSLGKSSEREKEVDSLILFGQLLTLSVLMIRVCVRGCGCVGAIGSLDRRLAGTFLLLLLLFFIFWWKRATIFQSPSSSFKLAESLFSLCLWCSVGQYLKEKEKDAATWRERERAHSSPLFHVYYMYKLFVDCHRALWAVAAIQPSHGRAKIMDTMWKPLFCFYF